MATRATIEAEIADDLARSDLTDQIAAAVNAAIRAYRFTRFAFNEAYRVTATLSVSTASIALSSLSVRFRDIDRVRVQTSGGELFDLYRRDYNWIMSRQDVSTTTMPTEFCVYNDTLHFDSDADANYTVMLDGLKELGNAASATYTASDVSAWFNDARQLIRHRARKEVYAYVLKDVELAAMAGAAEKDALDTLKAEMSTAVSTGFLRPTEF